MAPDVLALPQTDQPAAVSRPLSTEERIRFAQLTRIVETNLDSFLAAGKALAEIKSSRLYRERFSSFEEFARTTFGLARSTCDQLVRSTATADLLLANGVTLPPNTTEAVVRPVSSLPVALQTVGWQLIQAVSPENGPTQPIASKVVRTIKNALEPLNGANGNGHKPRHRQHPSRERPFVQAAQRLSAYKGFEAHLVVSHIEKLPSAWSTHSACGTLIQRCQQVRAALIERFPELTNA